MLALSKQLHEQLAAEKRMREEAAVRRQHRLEGSKVGDQERRAKETADWKRVAASPVFALPPAWTYHLLPATPRTTHNGAKGEAEVLKASSYCHGGEYPPWDEPPLRALLARTLKAVPITVHVVYKSRPILPDTVAAGVRAHYCADVGVLCAVGPTIVVLCPLRHPRKLHVSQRRA
jgi:hypothetical protein